MYILSSLSGLARSGVALALCALCLGIRYWILPVEQGLAFLTIYPGTALTALLCGLGPTILYIVVAGAVGSYIFLPPYWSFSQASHIPVTAFFVSATTILLVIHFFQRRVSQQTQKLLQDNEARQQLVHELEHANTVLMARETELAQSQRIAKIGSWSWDAHTNTTYASPELCRILGVEKVPAFAEQDGVVLPHQAWLELRDAKQDVIANGTGYNLDLPALHADGRQIWLNSRAEAVRGPDGSVISMRGMVQDITERKKSESIVKSEHFIRVITDSVPVLLAYWDSQLRCQFANQAYVQFWGVSTEYILSVTMQEMMGESLFVVNEPSIRAALAGEEQHFERFLSKPDGTVGHVLVHYIPDRDEHDNIPGFVIIVTDIKAMKMAEAELKLAANVFQNTSEAIMVTDANGLILSVNPAFTLITGYPAHEAVGQTPRLLRSHRHDQAFHTSLWQQINEKGFWQGEVWNRRKDGEVFLEWQTITRIAGADDASTRYLSVFHDITDAWQKNEHARYLAFHDALTKLPNRALLMERLERHIAMAEREPRAIAVMFLDLDRFKAVNDTLGHAVGDELLIAVGQKLQALVRKADTVARLGGDEFIIMLDNPASQEEVAQIAERVIATVNEPHEIQGHRVRVGTSIGIAMFPADGKTAAELIKNADTAMYEAKRAGRNGYRFFLRDVKAATLDANWCI